METVEDSGMTTTISGPAQLRVNGERIGYVEYRVAVTKAHKKVSAEGTIWARPELLTTAFEARKNVSLVREDTGHIMRIAIMSKTEMGSALISVKGNPGPL
jgi:hypothetical protein